MPRAIDHGDEAVADQATCLVSASRLTDPSSGRCANAFGHKSGHAAEGGHSPSNGPSLETVLDLATALDTVAGLSAPPDYPKPLSGRYLFYLHRVAEKRLAGHSCHVCRDHSGRSRGGGHRPAGHSCVGHSLVGPLVVVEADGDRVDGPADACRDHYIYPAWFHLVMFTSRADEHVT